MLNKYLLNGWRYEMDTKFLLFGITYQFLEYIQLSVFQERGDCIKLF